MFSWVSLYAYCLCPPTSLFLFFSSPVRLAKMSYKLFNPNVHPAVIGDWYTIART